MSAPGRSWGGHFAFRALFLFYVHFALTSAPFARLPGVDAWLQRYAQVCAPLVERLGALLRFEAPVTLVGAGARPSLFGCLLFAAQLALAALGALAWTLLDRRREPDLRLQAWFHWLLRLVLSGALIHYGMIKLVPTQMIAPPPPGVLLFRVGELVPNHLLWWFVGASPAFESVTGLAELAAGLLLLFPRTTLAGALLATADMATVFALNLAYDVPVKVYSFHLLLLSLLLVLPHRRRLASLFLLNRRVEAAAETPLSADPRRRRAAELAVIAFGLFFLTESALTTRERYAKLYPPRSPFFGAWSVAGFARDGRELPLHADPERWRWVTFGRPEGISIERMDGTPLVYRFDVDEARRAVAVRPPGPRTGAPAPEPIGDLRYRRPDANRLEFDGTLAGHRVAIRLERMELVRRR